MTERKMTEKKTSTMFCKICQDAGKPPNEYTNHNIRSGGIVTCKTLMNTVCRNCKQNGHTFKYCPVVKPTNNYLKRANKPSDNYFENTIRNWKKTEVENKNKKTNKNENVDTSNIYKYLCLDEDDEEEIITSNIQDEIVNLQVNPDVIAKPILIRSCNFNKNQCGTNVSDQDDDDDSIEDKDKDMHSSILKRKPAIRRRWCDYSSDEDE